MPTATHVEVTDDWLTVHLADGRAVSVPIEWFPRLLHGSPAERSNWRLLGQGDAIEWVELDEFIGVEALLAGRRSGESQSSLEKWLAGRDRAEVSGIIRIVEYRRRRGGAATWHWCSACSFYPQTDFETVHVKPSSGELCNVCRAKEFAKRCG
jgi:Protein of unknown function (DUF2442)